MIERLAFGEYPAKPHLALRGKDSALRYEECITRRGFEGPYTIAYHLHRPQALEPIEAPYRRETHRPADPEPPLTRRHIRTIAVPSSGPPTAARIPLLYNSDLVIGTLRPTEDDPVYVSNADADELFFVRRGGGTLRTLLGDLRFEAEDYVYVPKGLLHRFLLDEGEQDWLSIECPGGVGIPQRFRNELGQLRMDAPYSHRDFRRPTFRGPLDEGIRVSIVKRHDRFHRFSHRHSPLDVVGWDGTIYPWAFPILAFQPRVSAVHLPPTWHGTFAAEGALICSFVPRPLDFHPDAIPCPYPHSSVDIDEVLYYVRGDFTSRTGISEGSLTLHPAGIPHGPQPGRYEASIGTRSTNELAVMLDCSKPLRRTSEAAAAEDGDYDASFG